MITTLDILQLDRVYLKGLEKGNWCWSQVGNLKLDDLDDAPYNISPLTFIEVR